MANNFAYIEKTLPKVVDKVFAQSSLTEALLGRAEDKVKLDFVDARTVHIFKLASTGLTQYQRGGHGTENKDGSASTSYETFTLTQERWSDIPLDKLDSLDDGETVLAHLSTEFIRTKVVPEFDAYRFSKLAGYTNVTFGNRVVETIDENTIIAKFNKAFKWMKEQKVPERNQIIYVSPDVMEKIENSNELYKHLTQSEYRANVDFSIKQYMGRQIVEVPSDEFFTDIVIGDGYAPSVNSKVINFMIVDKDCVNIVKKLDHAKVYDSENTYLKFAGWKLTNLYYHDLFVAENKKVGIYASVSEIDANTVASALLVDAVKGASLKTHIRSVLTQPAGIIFDKLYLAKTPTVALGSNTRGLTEIKALPGGGYEDFTPDTSNNIIVASYDNKAVAVSKNFLTTLPKGD